LSWLDTTLLVLEIVLGVIAWAHVRRDRSHWPLALYLSWMALESPLRDIDRLARTGPSTGYAGLALAAFHLDKLIVFSWTFGFVALCVWYFLRRSAWPVFVLGAVVWLMALPHPFMTGERLAHYYAFVFTAGVVLSWLTIVWVVLFRSGSVEPTLAHWVLLTYACLDFVCTLAPFLELAFLAEWERLRVATIVVTSGAISAHVYWGHFRCSEVQSNGG